MKIGGIDWNSPFAGVGSALSPRPPGGQTWRLTGRPVSSSADHNGS